MLQHLLTNLQKLADLYPWSFAAGFIVGAWAFGIIGGTLASIMTYRLAREENTGDHICRTCVRGGG